MVEIAVALISLLGVIITVIYGNKKTTKSIKEQTNLTLYRIEQLEKKQDKHNTLIERMYAVEEDVSLLKEKAKVVNHRIDDLSEYHKP